MAKKSTQNNKKVLDRNGILPIIVGLLAIGFLAQSIFTFYLLRQNHTQDNQTLARQIIDAAEKTNSPLPQDPKTGAVFIYQAKLTLPPASAELGTVLYSYQDGTDNGKPVLHLARKNDINLAKSPLLTEKTVEKTFKGVPRLQACVRGVTIAFDHKDVGQNPSSKVLSNGKTIYFSTEPECMNQELLDYAKKIDSYN